MILKCRDCGTQEGVSLWPTGFLDLEGKDEKKLPFCEPCYLADEKYRIEAWLEDVWDMQW